MKKVILAITISGLFFACKSSKNTSTSTNTGNTSQTAEAARKGSVQKGSKFDEMDTNNDGRISRAEARGPIKDRFNAIDTNGDGMLSRSEMQNAKPKDGGKKPRR